MSTDGIRMKFMLKKINVEPCDPMACYFVLRFDGEQSNEDYMHASRAAGRAFANVIREKMPSLANDIDLCLDELERWPCGCREAACPHEPLFSSVWRYGDTEASRSGSEED